MKTEDFQLYQVARAVMQEEAVSLQTLRGQLQNMSNSKDLSPEKLAKRADITKLIDTRTIKFEKAKKIKQKIEKRYIS